MDALQAVQSKTVEKTGWAVGVEVAVRPPPLITIGGRVSKCDKTGKIMVFVDGIVLTQKFSGKEYPDGIKQMAGVRRISYRSPGDIDLKGNVVVDEEVIGESFTSAWIQGSHDSKLQLRSDGNTLSIKGNPGRWNRPENLFNFGFEETIALTNKIVAKEGFPLNSFHRGERDPYTKSQLAAMDIKAGDQLPEEPWTGSRVWSIHLTQNYITGSAKNAKAVIDWADTQSVARVKKSRLGATTLIWGSIKYCQTELYIKADEMLAHCKTPEARAAMRLSAAYQYAEENGIIRLEVKCAKDFLKHENLTYLGNWNMGTVTRIFKEKAEVLERCALAEAADDADIIAALPRKVRVHAAAWFNGIDVAPLMSRATFFRHAKVLRDYGIDISEVRNITVIRPKMREISISPAVIPSWYHLAA